MAIPMLTTPERVKVRLSSVGVGLRIDHFPVGALDECILSASSDVAVFLSRYPLVSGESPGLDSSDVVATWTADVAVFLLCGYRANPVPASVKARYEWVMDQLAKVQSGQATIPDLQVTGTGPAITNHTIDYSSWPSKRRSALRSHPRRPTGFPSYPDHREPPPFPNN